MRNYRREEVLKKLDKLHHIKLLDGILHIPKRAAVGIKAWGMIDFLKARWTRTQK